MSATLKFLNAHNFPIFHPILIKLVSKSMVSRALSYKTYLSLGLLYPLRKCYISLKILKSDFWLSRNRRKQKPIQ